MTDRSLREQVLDELARGPALDASGRATRLLAERMKYTKAQTTLTTLLNKMERDGQIVRDQPNLKRCTRIELASKGVRPGRKSVEVIVEHAGRDLAARLERELRDVVDAHVAAATDGVEDVTEELADLRERVKALETARDQAKRQRDIAREERNTAQAYLQQLQDERNELHAQMRDLERSLESWKRKALGRSGVREVLVELRNEIEPDQRQALERLMRQLPQGR